MSSTTTVRLSLSRLFSAEWLKLRTLRSSWVCAVAAVVLPIGGALLLGLAHTDPDFVEGVTARDAVSSVLSSSAALSQISIMALAVLVLGSEYTGGAIRVTFVAAPRRLTVMAAKALLVAAVATVLAALSVGLGYATALPFLTHASLTGVPFGTVLGLIGAEIGYCVLVALFAFAVTLAVRNTAAGIGLALGAVLLLRVVLAVLDIWVGFDLTGLAFSVAATRVLRDPLSVALPVVLAWLAVPAVLGSLTLVRRDA
ncbi:ABC transporter permease [Actinoplanes sp. NPDC023936]|uniref:ABC transporter permease n=1 Tax=Actinoplanes sp. NPDC023936 TaxID=3154910 RepID=UPI0033CBDFF9